METILVVSALINLALLAVVAVMCSRGAQATREVSREVKERAGQSAARIDALEHGLRGDAARTDAILGRFQQSLERQLGANEERMERVRETVERQLSGIQRDNAEKLESMRATVDKRLGETLEQKLGESFRTVGKLLGDVHTGLGEMKTLAEGVGDLKKVMTGVKTRGIWGETQLGALLEQMLAPEQYLTNVAVVKGSSERVEFAVRLPGDGAGVLLPIDAKFPLEDYQRLIDAQEAADAPRAEDAGKQLEAAIRNEAKRIQSKYISPPDTTDFAVMYLPVEGLFAEVIRREGLIDALQNAYRVSVAGPTTLAALLTSLQMGFRTLAIQKRSSEVWQLLGVVRKEFGTFGKALDDAQKKIESAGKSIELTTKRTQIMDRKLRDVELPDAAEPLTLLPAEDE